MINMFKKIGTSILLVASMLMMSISFSAAAGDVLADIVDDGVLKVAMSGDQPPYNVKSRAKTLIGYDVDLARALASAMQVKLEIVEVPFGDLMSTLNSGKADMVISGMAITAQRTQEATFIGPYNVSGKSILSTREVMEKVAQEGFNNESNRVVALKNSTSKTFAEKKMPKATISSISNYEEGVKLILEGKADALVADMAICKLAVLRNPNTNLVTSQKPMSIEPIGIAIASGNPQLENIVSNYLVTFERMGILATLQDKWFENGNWIVALP